MRERAVGPGDLNAGNDVLSGGQGLDFASLSGRCPGVIPPPTTEPSPAQLAACLDRLGVHTLTNYQPATRFWAFQGIEFAIYGYMITSLFLDDNFTRVMWLLLSLGIAGRRLAPRPDVA